MIEKIKNRDFQTTDFEAIRATVEKNMQCFLLGPNPFSKSS
jgi:hypothetical protein